MIQCVRGIFGCTFGVLDSWQAGTTEESKEMLFLTCLLGVWGCNLGVAALETPMGFSLGMFQYQYCLVISVSISGGRFNVPHN